MSFHICDPCRDFVLIRCEIKLEFLLSWVRDMHLFVWSNGNFRLIFHQAILVSISGNCQNQLDGFFSLRTLAFGRLWRIRRNAARWLNLLFSQLLSLSFSQFGHLGYILVQLFYWVCSLYFWLLLNYDLVSCYWIGVALSDCFILEIFVPFLEATQFALPSQLLASKADNLLVRLLLFGIVAVLLLISD